MSGESDSLQLINPDTNNLDSSDDVIELDSDDAESDDKDSQIGSRDIDANILECPGLDSKLGLDLVEHRSDEACIPSADNVVSELSLVSKCPFNANGTEGNGSAPELATSQGSSLEGGHKDSQALSMRNNEDVPSLESRGDDPVALVSGEDTSAQECLISNMNLAVEGNLELRDVPNVLGTEGHDSTTMAASNQSSSGNKSSMEDSERNRVSKENSEKNKDSRGYTERNKHCKKNSEKNTGTEKDTEGNKDYKENSEKIKENRENSEKNEVTKEDTERNKDCKEISDKNKYNGEIKEKNEDCKGNAVKNRDSKENLEKNKDSKENSAKNKDSKENLEKNKDSKENSEKNKDSRENLGKNKDSKENSAKNRGSKENAERSRDSKENSEKNKDSRENLGKNKDSKENSAKNRGSKENAEKNRDSKENSEKNKDSKENSERNKDSKDNSEKNKESKENLEKTKDIKGNSAKNSDSKENSEKIKDSKENAEINQSSKENSEKNKDSKENSEKNKDSKDNSEKNRDSKENLEKNRDSKENLEKNKDSKDNSEKNKDSKENLEKNKDSKENLDKNRDSKENSKKKQHGVTDDAKRKSPNSNIEKKDESRRDRRNSKKRSLSRDRKGSGAKSGKSNRSPEKKDNDKGRTKRHRSGSKHREDEVRKRRRVSKSRSRSRRRDHHSRTRNAFDHEREKTRQVSDILQGQIDRLKDEVEKARAELKRSSRRSRSRSLGRRRSNTRTFDHRGSPFSYRSRSRSLDQFEISDSISRQSPLPSVQRFLGGSFASNSEDKQVVVVKKVDVKDQSVRFHMLTKFKRYGEVFDSSFDLANKAAILHYKRHECAQEAVKGMNNRYYRGEYLVVMLVNERDADLAITTNSESGKGHSPNEHHRMKSSRSHSRNRERRARSSSLGLHWPAQPRHPSTNLFEPTRALSPLSLLMATESLRDGGNRPVVFRPRPLPTALTKTSADLPLGPERVAKRELMMKKMNSIVKCDWGERSLSDFEVLATVGKGTYGQMYKAADKDLKLLMALKKVAVENDKSGFPVSALQEMKLLSRLDHPNIVKLVEILREDQENFVGAKRRGTFYFVYDYMNHDLKRLLQSKLLQLKSEDVAWFIKQLLSALSYCHRFGLVHRDVRPSNILINNRGELKLTQFGLACLYDEKAEPPAASSLASTEQRMVSLWYRAPELLLGAKKSSPATDIWSCGCVIGEIFSRKPVFLGSDEQHQIEVISKVCGTPNTSNWPDVASLPLHYILKNVEDYPRLFHDAFHYVPYMARNLLDLLLVMDPVKRLTAESALDTDWLKDADFPKMLPMMLVNINDCHMLMPAKSSIDSDIHCLPGVGRASSVSLEDHKLEGFAGNNIFNRIRKEDASDKVAIAHSLGSTSVHESDTVWKPLAGRETIGLSVSGAQVIRESAEKPRPMSSQPNRQTFNPRVMDYACQPTYAKPVSLPEKPVLQPEPIYTGSLSVRSEDQPLRMRPPGEDVKTHTDRSLQRRPVALPSGTKTAAQASDDRTFAADLQRLRALKKQLEMVGTEKRDSLAGLAKTGYDAENWEAPPARKGNLGESAEFGVDRFKRSTDVANTGFQVSFESEEGQWENEPFPKRTAISGQPLVEKTSFSSEPVANTSCENMEASYRRQKQPVKDRQSWQSESSDFGGSWEEPYKKVHDEGNPLPLHEPRSKPVGRPTIASGHAPVMYGDTTVNRLQRSYTAASDYGNSKPYDDLSGFTGEQGVHQQLQARPPYYRKPLPSQMNPEIRGPASAAQAWDESSPYPENTAEQQWGYDREMEVQRSRYPGRGFAESAPHPDERWRADDRWSNTTGPHPGPFCNESDVEWRAPQSRF